MTSDKKKRFIIADPSLADVRGHHFELTAQITQGAEESDMDVFWMTNKSFRQSDFISHIPVYPIFTTTMYDRYKRQSNKGNNDPTESIFQEMENALNIALKIDADAILFHTAYADIYESAFRLYSGSGWESLPILHLCTPYDCDTMPGRRPENPLPELFGRLRSMPALERQLFLWTETPQLAVDYAARFAMTVRALPLPPPVESPADVDTVDDTVVNVLYLGAAREEKGFLQLPELVERLHPIYGKTGQLHFTVQCTPQIIGYLPSIKEAINRLRCYTPNFVTLIEDFTDRGTYLKYLRESDIVLLLYNQKGYRIRGSGIAIESICANKSILTTKETFCSSLITHGGGCAVENLDQAVKFFDDYVTNRNHYKKQAEIQGKAYRERYSIKKYLKNIFLRMDSSTHAPFYPSVMVGYISPSLIDI